MKNVLSILAIFICSTAFGQTAVFTSIPTSHGCIDYPLTWVAEPGHTSYVWTISGTNGTTYTINDGCNSTSNTCTITRHNDINAYNGGLSIILRMRYAGATNAIGTALYDVQAQPSPYYTGLCWDETSLSNAQYHGMQTLETGYAWTFDGTPFNPAGTSDYAIVDSTFSITAGKDIHFRVLTAGTHIVTGTFATPAGCVGKYTVVPYTCTTNFE